MEHYKKLERMYLSANLNQEIYKTTTVKIEEGKAQIQLKVEPKYFYALGAAHGSVYFKLLDDDAFFAINSIGKIKFKSKNLYIAENSLFNEAGKEIAFGSGHFAKSKIKLTEKIGYK